MVLTENGTVGEVELRDAIPGYAGERRGPVTGCSYEKKGGSGILDTSCNCKQGEPRL